MMSPFVFHPIKHNKDFAWSIQSTVQSVRFDGPSGFPLRCDWVIGTRLSHWRRIAVETVFGDPRIKPKTIFVMREHLQHFHDYILPCLQRQERFVLIVGDQDTTTPRQIDKRYRFKPPVGIFYPSGQAKRDCDNFEYSTWLTWMSDARIGHIFVEHLDENTHPKVSPIPIGLSPHEISRKIMHYSTCDILEKLAFSPISSRPLKVRFTNRLREGPQFESRRLCKEACDTSWKSFCVSARAPGGEAFLREIQKYPFLICAHGGGIDPNPMAWTALLVGTIPIIQRFAGDSIYDDLPVVRLDELPSEKITLENLRSWRDRLAPMFEGHNRRQVLQRLTTDHWWNKTMAKVREIERGGTTEASLGFENRIGLGDAKSRARSRQDSWEKRKVENMGVARATLPGQTCSLIVLVLSARENFVSRQQIRTSWKDQGSSCIYFMVEDAVCEVNEWTHEAGDESDTGVAAQKHHDATESEVQACLEQEAEENGDVVFLHLKDCDKNLPRKLEESYRWALQSSSASWLLKVDDDVVFVNTCRLEDYLSSLDQQHRTVVGRIWNQSEPVRRTGKWADLKHRERDMGIDAPYSAFLVESFGYVVSRDVATEVVDMDKTKYQGEDASLGILLEESPVADDLIWISAAGFVNDAAVWFGKQELARDANADVMVLSHGKERNYVLSRGNERNVTWQRVQAVLSHGKERKRLQDELYWCPGAQRRQLWRESALHTAVDASAPTGQSQGVFDWEGDASALRDWLVEREFHYSDGVVRGVPCASRAEGCTGADRMSSEEHEYASCYAKLLEDHRRMWTHQHQTGRQHFLAAEVGILKGSGLALWSDLFSSSARIHGFDKYLDTARNNLDFLGEKAAFAKNNTFLHEMDQLVDNREMLGRVAQSSKFVFVVDDGLHTEEALVATFESFYEHLADSFLYVMEDVASTGLLNSITSRIGRRYAVRFQQCAGDRQFLAIMPRHVLKIAPSVTRQSLREVSASLFAREPSASGLTDSAPLPICIGVLAYHGVMTLEKTLFSYERAGLLDMTAAAHIYFQELDSPERMAWAQDVVDRYPSLQPIYGEANTEYRAMLALVSACDTSIADFIIVLEEDFAVSSSMTASDVYAQLSNGVWLLEHGVHAVRMRHRKDWGSGGDPERSLLDFLRDGVIGGGRLMSHVMWDNAAETHVPEISVCRATPKTWCASAAHAHYTTDPVLYRIDFVRALYARVRNDQMTLAAFEGALRSIWAQTSYTVAYSDAIFTHARVDSTPGVGVAEGEAHGR